MKPIDVFIAGSIVILLSTLLVPQDNEIEVLTNSVEPPTVVPCGCGVPHVSGAKTDCKCRFEKKNDLDSNYKEQRSVDN